MLFLLSILLEKSLLFIL